MNSRCPLFIGTLLLLINSVPYGLTIKPEEFDDANNKYNDRRKES